MKLLIHSQTSTAQQIVWERIRNFILHFTGYVIEGIETGSGRVFDKMHEGACEHEVKSIGCYTEGFDIPFAQAQVHCANKTLQIGLNNDYNMAI